MPEVYVRVVARPLALTDKEIARQRALVQEAILKLASGEPYYDTDLVQDPLHDASKTPFYWKRARRQLQDAKLIAFTFKRWQVSPETEDAAEQLLRIAESEHLLNTLFLGKSVIATLVNEDTPEDVFTDQMRSVAPEEPVEHEEDEGPNLIHQMLDQLAFIRERVESRDENLKLLERLPEYLALLESQVNRLREDLNVLQPVIDRVRHNSKAQESQKAEANGG